MLIGSIPSSVTVLTATPSIPNGASSLSVEFDVPFRAAPAVFPCIQKGSGGDPNVFLTGISDVTKDGFTAYFSASTTLGTYTLHYAAIGL